MRSPAVAILVLVELGFFGHDRQDSASAGQPELDQRALIAAKDFGRIKAMAGLFASKTVVTSWVAPKIDDCTETVPLATTSRPLATTGTSSLAARRPATSRPRYVDAIRMRSGRC